MKKVIEIFLFTLGLLLLLLADALFNFVRQSDLGFWIQTNAAAFLIVTVLLTILGFEKLKQRVD
ncbi:MAG: hypothetical protein AAF433_08850 [Bacteroidota bacterium]